LDDSSQGKGDDSLFTVVEWHYKNCNNPGDCDNCYLYLDTEWHVKKFVVSTDHDVHDTQKMMGLKVQEGHCIPQWDVLGEYTGEVELTTRYNPLTYCVAINRITHIDAEKGCMLLFVNHRWINVNPIMVTVCNGSTINMIVMYKSVI